MLPRIDHVVKSHAAWDQFDEAAAREGAAALRLQRLAGSRVESLGDAQRLNRCDAPPMACGATTTARPQSVPLNGYSAVRSHVAALSQPSLIPFRQRRLHARRKLLCGSASRHESTLHHSILHKRENQMNEITPVTAQQSGPACRGRIVQLRPMPKSSACGCMAVRHRLKRLTESIWSGSCSVARQATAGQSP